MWYQRSLGRYGVLTSEPVGFREVAQGWSERSTLGTVLGSIVGRCVGCG